jgi:glutamyl-tRNA synthetase
VFFFRAPAAYDDKAVRKHVTPDILESFREVIARFDALPVWSAPAVHAFITEFAASKGIPLGKLAQPLRLAVCGGTVSPPIDATLAILGKPETLSRLHTAVRAWNGG